MLFWRLTGQRETKTLNLEKKGGLMFDNRDFGGVDNPKGRKDDASAIAFQVIKGLCILGLCALVFVILVQVIPPLGDMIAEWILSFFRRIRFGSGTDGVIGLGMVLIFLIGIARLVSNHFRN